MAKYADLSERVSATFYNDECEEWMQQTVTIADILDSVCDSYTALPPAQLEPSIPLSWIEEYIEQLRNARGIYSELRVNIINRMMYEWNKEQKGVKHETD